MAFLMNVLVLGRLLANHFKLFFIAEVLCCYKHVFCLRKSIELMFLKENESIQRKFFLKAGVLSLCGFARVLCVAGLRGPSPSLDRTLGGAAPDTRGRGGTAAAPDSTPAGSVIAEGRRDTARHSAEREAMY